MINHLKISYRLGIGFFIIFLLFISLTFFSISRMKLLSNQTVLMYNHPLTVSNSVLRMTYSFVTPVNTGVSGKDEIPALGL